MCRQTSARMVGILPESCRGSSPRRVTPGIRSGRSKRAARASRSSSYRPPPKRRSVSAVRSSTQAVARSPSISSSHRNGSSSGSASVGRSVLVVMPLSRSTVGPAEIMRGRRLRHGSVCVGPLAMPNARSGMAGRLPGMSASGPSLSRSTLALRPLAWARGSGLRHGVLLPARVGLQAPDGVLVRDAAAEPARASGLEQPAASRKRAAACLAAANRPVSDPASRPAATRHRKDAWHRRELSHPVAQRERRPADLQPSVATRAAGEWARPVRVAPKAGRRQWA